MQLLRNRIRWAGDCPESLITHNPSHDEVRCALLADLMMHDVPRLLPVIRADGLIPDSLSDH
jgi:hypothetical protein